MKEMPSITCVTPDDVRMYNDPCYPNCNPCNPDRYDCYPNCNPCGPDR